MNPNPPKDYTFTESDEWQLIHINRCDKTCLIRKANTGRSYSCAMADWLSDSIMLHDYVDVQFNPMSRVWMVIDYRINVEVYGSIHNTYQDNLDDLIFDENGVPL